MYPPRYAVPTTAAALLLLLSACGGGNGSGTPGAADPSTKADTGATITAPAATGEAAATTAAANPAADNAAAPANNAAAPAADQTPAPAPATGAPQPAPGTPVATDSSTEAAAGITPQTPVAEVQDTATPAAANAAQAAQPPAHAATAAAATGQPDDATPTAAARPAAPAISRAGVSGEALLTMLGQRACAEPVETSGLNGPPVPTESRELPQILADLAVTPENYTGSTLPDKPIINAVCDPQMAQYKLIQPGEHKVDIFSQRHYLHDHLGRPDTRRPFSNTRVSIPLTVTETQVTLGAQVGDAQNPYLASQTLSFARQGQVGYGVLSQWVQNGNNLRMLLVPGQKDNEARLCWNTHNVSVKRLHCMAWSQPEGWKPGDALQLEDQYIIDDRSTYAGESGLMYLHSRNAAQP